MAYECSHGGHGEWQDRRSALDEALNFNPFDIPAPAYVTLCIVLTAIFWIVLRKIEEYL